MSAASLVVAIVSPNGDYVVVAAESRNTNGADLKPVDDDACKIISLDGKTLFFETGESYYHSPEKGERWDTRAIARTMSSKSKNHDAHALSLAWPESGPRVVRSTARHGNTIRDRCV